MRVRNKLTGEFTEIHFYKDFWRVAKDETELCNGRSDQDCREWVPECDCSPDELLLQGEEWNSSSDIQGVPGGDGGR